MDEALTHVLLRMPEPIQWDEEAEEAARAAAAKPEAEQVTAH